MKNLTDTDKMMISIFGDIIVIQAIQDNDKKFFSYQLCIPSEGDVKKVPNYIICESSNIFTDCHEAIEIGKRVLKNYINYYKETNDMDLLYATMENICHILLQKNFLNYYCMGEKLDFVTKRVCLIKEYLEQHLYDI